MLRSTCTRTAVVRSDLQSVKEKGWMEMRRYKRSIWELCEGAWFVADY